MNSHNVYIYVLKCIFYESNLFRVYSCSLVWMLFYIFMVADLFEKWEMRNEKWQLRKEKIITHQNK